VASFCPDWKVATVVPLASDRVMHDPRSSTNENAEHLAVSQNPVSFVLWTTTVDVRELVMRIKRMVGVNR